jgi:hypothetical protein
MADTQTISLPVPLIQSIMNYMQQQPYQDVASLIAGIMQYNPPIVEVPKSDAGKVDGLGEPKEADSA